MRGAWSAAFVAVALVACGRKDAPARDAAPPPPSSAATTAGAAPLGPLCPRTGHWGECQLRIRLEQSGLAPIATKENVGDVPALSVPPVRFHIGSAGMALYFFADTLARRKAAAGLDTAKFIPPSRAVGMRAEATVIESDNMLAILFSRNEHQRERVADAVLAGPPQP